MIIDTVHGIVFSKTDMPKKDPISITQILTKRALYMRLWNVGFSESFGPWTCHYDIRSLISSNKTSYVWRRKDYDKYED